MLRSQPDLLNQKPTFQAAFPADGHAAAKREHHWSGGTSLLQNQHLLSEVPLPAGPSSLAAQEGQALAKALTRFSAESSTHCSNPGSHQGSREKRDQGRWRERPPRARESQHSRVIN